MTSEMKIPKKLIEVALPLDAINKAAAREKSIRHGHPSTLHLWWARRPLAAARAVIFAQMVNDPGYERALGRGVNKQNAKIERDRLFRIIERLVQWENINNQEVLEEARQEIVKSWQETCALNKDHPRAKELFDPQRLPPFIDPFAGGGAIPLEANRLGLDTIASDLNPIAVSINKAMLEVPARFTGIKPIGPKTKENDSQEELIQEWRGASGLAEDVRRYAGWIKSKAIDRVGSLYQEIEISDQIIKQRPDLKHLRGQSVQVVAWLWARTVKSPNPAFAHVEVPLVASFRLSDREGSEAWVEPKVRKDGSGYDFRVRVDGSPKIEETVNRRGAICLMSGSAMPFDYIRAEGKEGRLGSRLMAIVADGPTGRIFLDPTEAAEKLAFSVQPKWKPTLALPDQALGFRVQLYGMKTYGDLFTQRQLVCLTTLSDLVLEVREKILQDAKKTMQETDDRSFADGGRGPKAYSEAVSVYLAFAVDKTAEGSTTICTWSPLPSKLHVVSTFGRQALPMTWDYAEANIFADSSGNFERMADLISNVIDRQFGFFTKPGEARQIDAAKLEADRPPVISTDPPYYDNIGYSDLSDFFYVWMRPSLKTVFPTLFSETAVPKLQELVATPFRHGSKENAERFFLEGMTQVMHRLSKQAHPNFPVTIYYAFKQSETEGADGTASTGWETFLEAVIRAGFAITGTWPMRTERAGGFRNKGQNALASSIILVCQKRTEAAVTASRRDFIRELNTVLPDALVEMTTGGEHSPVAPVDLSQAIIGPGMAIYSKYSAVLEADGRPMSVKTALRLINRFFAEEDFDHDTQFCLQWFDEHGWNAGRFGEADVLARAKGTSVEGLKESGIVESSSGTLRLFQFDELPPSWRPESDTRVSVWELLHHMIARFNADGESGAGELLSRAGQFSETVRTLAYRLYTLCERKGWSQDAGNYDSLVRAWDSIESAARSTGYSGTQISLFGADQAESPEKSEPKKKTRKKL